MKQRSEVKIDCWRGRIRKAGRMYARMEEDRARLDASGIVFGRSWRSSKERKEGRQGR